MKSRIASLGSSLEGGYQKGFFLYLNCFHYFKNESLKVIDKDGIPDYYKSSSIRASRKYKNINPLNIIDMLSKDKNVLNGLTIENKDSYEQDYEYGILFEILTIESSFYQNNYLKKMMLYQLITI